MPEHETRDRARRWVGVVQDWKFSAALAALWLLFAVDGLLQVLSQPNSLHIGLLALGCLLVLGYGFLAFRTRRLQRKPAAENPADPTPQTDMK